MNVLIVGSGGREHALYWKVLQSSLVDKVYVYPGNAGIQPEHRITGVDPGDFFGNHYKGLIKFIKENEIDLLIVGPERYLVDGIADAVKEYCLVFGPTKEGARIESSKSWARSFMERFGIPSTKFQVFSDTKEAIAYLETLEPPYVIKADGPAEGKGVTVTANLEEAKESVIAILEKQVFGPMPVVIEEFMEGKEASVFGILDGKNAVLLQPARDYKRAFDNNTGPNTGGMGSVTPVPYIDDALLEYIKREIFDKVVFGFRQLGIDYRGVLYAGLMIHNHEARVVEFNCRFGDPETQVLMPVLESDAVKLFMDAAGGFLSPDDVRFSGDTCMTVVVASEGYPKQYRKHIQLDDFLNSVPGEILVFHAGTERDAHTKTVFSTGGRILNITAKGKSIEEVRQKVYAFLEEKRIPGTFFRKDIGIV